MLKFEERWEGNFRKLIVKNITEKDLKESISCEAKGEKCSAKLEKQSPFVNKLEKAEGFMNGIAVFNCRVHPGIQVSWSVGGKQINKQNFR
jgi:hypothetical protein